MDEPEDVGEDAEPARGFKSAKRLKEEEQEIDEAEEGSAGRTVKRGDTGIVGVESPVEYLGGMKGDVGVVEWVSGYRQEQVVQQPRGCDTSDRQEIWVQKTRAVCRVNFGQNLGGHDM